MNKIKSHQVVHGFFFQGMLFGLVPGILSKLLENDLNPIGKFLLAFIAIVSAICTLYVVSVKLKLLLN